MKTFSSIKKIFLLILGISITTTVMGQPTPPPGKVWEPVPEMTDEFNGGFDTNKWEKVLWDYPNTPTKMLAANSGVSGGNLWIKATLGPEPLWFQSSRVTSTTQIRYPMYTECSMITAHLSAYNTFWLNNGNIDNRDEIDVVENNSRPSCGCQPNFPWQMNSQYFQATNGFTVRNADNFDNRNLSPNNPKRGIPWNETYHTVGVWWKDAKNMTFYLDGEEAGSVTVGEDRSGANYPEIIFDRNLDLIWDLWTDDENFLGGAAVRSHLTDDSINTMKVDWVHTYRLVDGQSPPNPNPNPSGDTIVIEAENFNNTGGTFNDSSAGGPGLGVNKAGTIINYVNSNDFAEYTINVGNAGTYEISYNISTPSDNAQIQLAIGGNSVTTNVPNNGSWNTFNNLTAANTINLSSGNQTIRITASGSNQWQWNLDKITLRRTSGNTPPPPTPSTLVIEAENFNGTGGTYNDAFAGGPGLGVNPTASNINYVNTGDYADYNINVPVTGTYNIEYTISTPMDNAQIQLLVDGTVASTTNVPNNGSWDNFTSLAGGNATLSAGAHTIRILASNATVWQWNLDKITLVTGTGKNAVDKINLATNNRMTLFPNPASNEVNASLDYNVNNAKLRIFNIQGKEIYKNNFSGKSVKVNTSNFNKGLYFIKIETANLLLMEKLILK